MKNSKKPKKSEIVTMAAFLVIGGFGLTGFGLYRLYYEVGTFFFSPVQGVVTHSRIGRVFKNGRTMERRSILYPDIKYRYEVNGTAYINGRYQIRVADTGYKSMEATLKRYRVGTKVNGWYDPKKPSVAVISRAITLITCLALGFGLFPLGMLVMMYRMYGRKA